MIMATSEHQLQDWKYENKLLEKFLCQQKQRGKRETTKSGVLFFN